ncbi:MAG: hypothetical protein GX985_06820 [Gallicola sp.]|nr:hypothetical protein [Gallicola sp.]
MYGWTLSGEMELSSYLAANLLVNSKEDSQNRLDAYFYEYYSEKNGKNTKN